MPERIRVGVIGTSWWAGLMHLPSLTSHAGASVVALCGRDEARAGELARGFEVPLVFTDYRRMIDEARLDMAVIAAPDDLHYAMALYALEAGLHVVCEKPLALTAAHARELLQHAEAQRLRHMTFFTFRWSPVYRHVRALLDQGVIGRCRRCHLRYLSDHGRSSQYAWRFDPARSTGVVGDLGSHMIDLARWLVGDITTVSATLQSIIARRGIEGDPTTSASDMATLAMEFEGGGSGEIEVSAVSDLEGGVMEQRVVLYGDTGTLEATLTFAGAAEVRLARAEQDAYEAAPIPGELWPDAEAVPPAFLPMLGLFAQQAIGDRLFIDAIVQGHPVQPTFYDGLKTQEVVDAALASARKSRPIVLATGNESKDGAS